MGHEMEAVAAKLVRDQLEGGAGIIVCETKAPDFPAICCSNSFTRFTGMEAPCRGQSLISLLGVRSAESGKLDKDETIMSSLAACTGQLSHEELRNTLDTLGLALQEQCAMVIGEPTRRVGFSLDVCRDRHGEFHACEVTMVVLCHPSLGFSYLVALVSNIADKVTVGELLRSTAQREVTQFVQTRASMMVERASQYKLAPGDNPLERLHDMVSKALKPPRRLSLLPQFLGPDLRRECSNSPPDTPDTLANSLSTRAPSIEQYQSEESPKSLHSPAALIPQPAHVAAPSAAAIGFGDELRAEAELPIAPALYPVMTEAEARLPIAPALYAVEGSRRDATGRSAPGGRGSNSKTTVAKAVALKSGSLSLQDLDLRKTVGTGTFGRVRLVKVKGCSDRTPLALKIMKKREILRLKQIAHVRGEISVLAQVEHPFIIHLLAYFQDEKRLFLLMEYVNGGELFSRIRKLKGLPPDHARFYTGEVTIALSYLHARSIAHRDLKPENVLLASDGHVKLADFGFAKVVEDGQRAWTMCGTPEYVAPEIIQRKGHSKAVDWWALGVLVFEMLTGSTPFKAQNTLGVYQKVLHGHVDYPESLDKRGKDLVRRLLEREETKRLGNLHDGSKDLAAHKWLSGLDWDRLQSRKVQAPYIPAVRSSDDTSMYFKYDESAEDESSPPLTPEERALFASF